MEEDQARPDPGISRVALTGPDPDDSLSLTGTLSSTRNLEDAYAIRDQFINDKSTNDESGKLNVEAEVVSMVTVPIYQVITKSELAERVAVLEKKLSDLEHNNKNLDNTTRNLGSSVYTLELRDLPHKINEAVHKNVKEAVQIALQAPLQDRFRDLSEEDMKEMLHQRMFKLAWTNHFWNISHSMKLLRHLWNHSHKLISHQHGRSLTLEMLLQAPLNNNLVLMRSNQSKIYQYKILTTYLIERTRTLPIFQRLSRGQNGQCFSYHVSSSGGELFTCKDWDMRTFIKWYFQKMEKTELTQEDLEDQIDWANPEGDQVRIDISKPLPLSGLPGHVTIQTQFFFSKDLDYLHYGSKGSRQALSISKMKVARYHNFGLELLIPEHMWIDDVWTYDISVSYGISHWWFNHQKFYIDRYTAESSRKVVRTHMRILSVVRIKAYSRYGYDYLKEITLRRVDHQEYKIAKKDFKNFQNWRDLPRDNPLVSVEVLRYDIKKRSKSENKGIVPTEMELVLEQTQQVDIEKVAVRSSLRSLKLKRIIESRAKRSSINLIRTLFHITCSSHNVKTRVIIRVLRIILMVLPEHPSDTYVFTMKMKILLEPTSNKLMRTCKLGDFDVHTLEDPTLILEILSRRFFLRLNLPDHRSVLTGSGGSSKDGDGDTSYQWSLFHDRMLILDQYIK
ncbi:hypothetical protein Tco_0000048 [Tanacetum coccineum]